MRIWCFVLLACLVLPVQAATARVTAPVPVPGFPEPLIAMGPVSARDQQDLSGFLASQSPGSPADLEAFLAAHPQSPYRLAILTDLGLAA